LHGVVEASLELNKLRHSRIHIVTAVRDVCQPAIFYKSDSNFTKVFTPVIPYQSASASNPIFNWRYQANAHLQCPQKSKRALAISNLSEKQNGLSQSKSRSLLALRAGVARVRSVRPRFLSR
jgi:hypothetical protein